MLDARAIGVAKKAFDVSCEVDYRTLKEIQ